MKPKTFGQWLCEDDRREALQDVYFEDQIGSGSEFLDWAESVFMAMQKPVMANEPYPRSWPFTQ